MNKGIVMEMNESSIIVMRSDGRFEKLPRDNRACQVGEEIIYAGARPRLKTPTMAIASGLVAAVVLCFVIFTGLTGTTASGQVVAYVTIDINPSIELGIDDKEIVVDVRGLNHDGEQLISSLNHKGKKLETVTEEILNIAEQSVLSSGEADIIITSTLVQENTKINDQAVADKLREQTLKHIQSAHPEQTSKYEVTSFASPQEVRKQAQESGVSPGKYAIYLNAVNNGVSVTLDEIKEVPIHQIAKENGGISNLISPNQPISKSSLKQLVEDEKSGKLKEKAKQNEKDNKNKNKNDDKDDDDDNKDKKDKVNDKDKEKNNNSNKNNDNSNKSNNKNNNNNSNSNKKDDEDDDDDKKRGNAKPSPSVKPSIAPSFVPSIKPSSSPKNGRGDNEKDDKDDNRKGKQEERASSSTPNRNDGGAFRSDPQKGNDDKETKDMVDAIINKIDSMKEKEKNKEKEAREKEKEQEREKDNKQSER